MDYKVLFKNENAEVKKERTQYNSLVQALTKYSDELTAYKDALKKAKNSDKDIDLSIC